MLGAQTVPRRSRSKVVPAPVGGWNAKDAITAMPDTDAVRLINWFPRESNITARRGYAELCDLGTGSKVDMVFSGHGDVFALPSMDTSTITMDSDQYTFDNQSESTSRVFAASGGKLFHISNPEAVAEIGSGYASNYWVTQNFGRRVYCVNGEDAPIYISNATVSTASFTPEEGFSLTLTNLNFVFAYKNRLYFIEKNSQRMWYGGVDSLSGELKQFDFSLVQGFHGELMVLTALTGDGGQGGSEDLFVAIFSSGDVAVYSGSFPGADNWTKIGTYKIGRPMSRFAHTVYGSDIIIVTSRGYESLQRSMREGEGIRLRAMLSDKISGEVGKRLRVGPRPDWRIEVHEPSRMMIFQVPINNNSRQYHVRNIDTGAWCEFDLSDNGISWLSDSGNAYMGGQDGRVFQFDVGATDDEDEIRLTCETAWSFLGSQAIKTLHFMYLNLTGAFFPTFTIQVQGDFRKFVRSTQLNVGLQNPPAYWGTAQWNNSYWSAGVITKEYFHKHVERGRRIGLRTVCTGYIGELSWNSTTFVVEDGGLV